MREGEGREGEGDMERERGKEDIFPREIMGLRVELVQPLYKQQTSSESFNRKSSTNYKLDSVEGLCLWIWVGKT